MIEYELILDQLANNSYRSNVNENSDIDFEVFKQLFDARLVSAIDASTLEGGCFLNPKITFKGREYLENMKNPISNQPQPQPQPTINIGSVNSSALQIGDQNSMTTNITISELVEKVSKSNDQDAKNKLKELLNNATVATLIGVTASTLTSIL